MKIILTAIGSKYIHTALGLRSICAYAKAQGIETELIEDSAQTPLLSVLAEITAQEPDIVGLSVHIWNKNYVYSLIRLLRKVMPQVKIAVGGPEVSFDPQRIFGECPQIDYIIMGEGEETFVQLVRALADGGEVPEHVAYQKDGKVIANDGTTVVSDLDVLEFPYPDLAEVVNAKKIVYYECTRGCPFNCSYCLSGISRNMRKRSLEKVYADLDRLIAAKVPLVKFVDRTYNLDENYFLPIMQHLAQADTDATFHFEIKADLLSEKVLKFLETVPKGRFQFEIGVQTTNAPTLAAINRRDDWQKLTANVTHLLRSGNIHLHLDLIAGLPYEGLAEFEKSFNDVYGLQPHMLQLGFLKVLPGTQMEQQRDEHAIIYMDEPPYEILATKYINYNELRFLKVLEDVFDHTYNSGRFAHTLAYLTTAEGSAFRFYTKFAQWWQARGEYPLGHNVRGVTRLLYEFAQECYAEHFDKICELLRFDVLLYQHGWKPAFLKWHTDELNEKVMAFWRDAERVRRYVPDYNFATWRQIQKNYTIEYFDCDLLGDGAAYYLFVYNDEVQAIKLIDFEN